MAVCSLYEISPFLNLCLKIPGCIPIEQNRLAFSICHSGAMTPACLIRLAVHGAAGSFRSVDRKIGVAFFVKTFQSMRQRAIGLGSPRSMGVGVVVPSTRIPGGPCENFGKGVISVTRSQPAYGWGFYVTSLLFVTVLSVTNCLSVTSQSDEKSVVTLLRLF
jgi:hypothetical protein